MCAYDVMYARIQNDRVKMNTRANQSSSVRAMYAIAEFSLSIFAILVGSIIIYYARDFGALCLLAFMSVSAPLTIGDALDNSTMDTAAWRCALVIIAHCLVRFCIAFGRFLFIDDIREVTMRRVIDELWYERVLVALTLVIALTASTGAVLMLRRALYFAIAVLVRAFSEMRLDTV